MDELVAQIERARHGDLAAYGEIVRRFQDMAYGCAYAVLGDFHLAEDAAQDAFIEAYRKLSDLREPKAFPGWFRRIVLGQCNRITRKRKVPTVALDEATEIRTHAASPDAEAQKMEMKDKVLEAIRSLPDGQRMATTLFYINGYSQNEVADFLEVPISTVKKRLHDSRRKLKEAMVDMVAETLRECAPDAHEKSEQIRFLFLMADYLTKGVPAITVFRTLSTESASANLRRMADEIVASIKQGGTVSQGMEVYGKDFFPKKVISMIRKGECTGQLQHTSRAAGRWLQSGRAS